VGNLIIRVLGGDPNLMGVDPGLQLTMAGFIIRSAVAPSRR